MNRTPPIQSLGPEMREPVFGPGFYMRINDDLRKSVVFFGYPDVGKSSGIRCIGTGFLLAYKGIPYLITAKHLSHDLGDNPFLMRLNKHNGTSDNIHVDGAAWFEHPDPAVDVSAAHMRVGTGSGYDAVYIDGEMMMSPEKMKAAGIGVGNSTYTVGLFRLLSGEKRNLPVCHSGSIALVPGDEKIPIRDWTDANRRRRIFVDGYLVESLSISGLSGSPVFVRPEYSINLAGLGFKHSDPNDKFVQIIGSRDGVKLLGLWQGAWDAPPDEVLSAELPTGAVTVPVGMGIVVPCQRIIEVLEMPKVKDLREKHLASEQEVFVASPQSVAKPAAPPASDANPSHREDFMRLVGAAARKPPQED